MKEFVIICLLALVITPILSTFNVFNLPQDPTEITLRKPFKILRKITAEKGAAACLSQESLLRFTKFSVEKNSTAANEMVAEGLCVYFKQGVELLVQEGACEKGEIFSFILPSKKTEFFAPCLAILVK